MIRGIIRIGLLLLSGLLVVPAPFASARIIDGVVAVVNDEPITFSEVREAVAEGLGVPPGDADLYLREEKETARILSWIETIIESVLVRQELGKAAHAVTEKEIDGAVESVRKGNNLSEAEFAAALAREGITLAGYRRRVRWQMERGAVVRAKKMKEVTVTDEEVRNYYKENAERFLSGAEVRLESLIIPFPPEGAGGEPGVLVRIAAQQAAEYVKAGKTLAEAANLFSGTIAGVTVATSDFVKTDDLSPEVQKEVKRLKAGETSPPFFTEAGGYLLKVVERRGGTLPDLSSVRDALNDEILDRRSESAFADILTELKKAASIDVRL